MDKKIATGPMPEDSPPSGATKKRLVISNGFTDHLVHKWRSEEAAILVGSKTALYDDPALTARLWPGKDPLRLVIDTDLKLPATLQLFDRRAKTMVFNEQQHVPGEMLFYYKVDKGEEALQQIMTALYREKINSVMVEGGATLLQSFIDKGLWDEARVITNEKLWIGNGIEAPVLKNADFLRKEQLFNDSMVYYTKEKQ